LAKLETYDKAKSVLNKARETIPTDYTIYVAAAKLEETQGNGQIVGKIIHKALRNLKKHQVVLSRDQWLQEAVFAE
jgi:pre-mRNA-processing factor 6